MVEISYVEWWMLRKVMNSMLNTILKSMFKHSVYAGFVYVPGSWYAWKSNRGLNQAIWSSGLDQTLSKWSITVILKIDETVFTRLTSDDAQLLCCVFVASVVHSFSIKLLKNASCMMITPFAFQVSIEYWKYKLIQENCNNAMVLLYALTESMWKNITWIGVSWSTSGDLLS